MRECLEEIYLQANINKDSTQTTTPKHQVGSQKLDEYLKEFKGICDVLVAIQKPVDKGSKIINFARGLGLKYRTFRIVKLGKAPYPTLN